MSLPYETTWPLRSSGISLLTVPRVQYKHAEAAFSYFAPQSWNKFPEETEFDYR